MHHEGVADRMGNPQPAECPTESNSERPTLREVASPRPFNSSSSEAFTEGLPSQLDGSSPTIQDFTIDQSGIEQVCSYFSQYSEEPPISPSGRRIVYFENLMARNVDGHATAVGKHDFSPSDFAFVEALGSRSFLPSQGSCIISSDQKESVQGFSRYPVERGFASEQAIGRVVWVDSTTNSIEQIARQLVTEDLAVDPYVHRAALHTIARAHGLEVIGASDATASTVVERFNHKGQYRDFLVREHGLDAVPFPRLSLHPSRCIGADLDSAREQFERLVEYGRLYDRPYVNGARPIVIEQIPLSGGGVGNFIYSELKDGSFVMGESETSTPRFRDRDGLWQYIVATAKTGPRELAPFVEKVNAFSNGILSSPKGAVVIGPLDQLERGTSFNGWKRDINLDRAQYGDMNTELRRSAVYGEKLFQAGYRGWANEDAMRVVTPDGEAAIYRPESNVRRTGTTHAITEIIRHADLRERFLAGRLSVRGDEYVKIDGEAAIHARTSEQLVKYLEDKAGIVFASWDQPLGVRLMGAPVKSDEGYLVNLLFLSDSDVERDAMYDRTTGALE